MMFRSIIEYIFLFIYSILNNNPHYKDLQLKNNITYVEEKNINMFDTNTTNNDDESDDDDDGPIWF